MKTILVNLRIQRLLVIFGLLVFTKISYLGGKVRFIQNFIIGFHFTANL